MPQPLAFDREALVLASLELRFLAQKFFENTDFFLQIFDHVLLVAIQPAGNADHLKSKRIHRERMAASP